MSLERDKAHLAAAKVYASLSKAKRLQVGAVICRDDRIISIGYNGTPSGADNTCEYRIDHIDGLDQITSIEWKTKPEVIHAESNAIMFAAKNGVSTDGCKLVLTHSPCFDCSRLIIQSGIKEVVYETEYRDMSGIDFLEKNGVSVWKI